MNPPKPKSGAVPRVFNRFFILLAMALILGYLGRPPAQQLGTQGPGGAGVQLGPEGQGQGEAVGQDPEAIAAQQTQAQSQTQAQAAAGKKSTGKAIDPGSLACASGRNGGRTDIGVSATQIRLASTVVLDGPAASLLRDSEKAMKAVKDKINSQGGVCGRRLHLTTVNDGFRADLGHTYLLNFMEEKDPKKDFFAFPVVPSAEGLSSAIQSGDIQKHGVPVVGTDGMRIEQYDAKGKAKTVWPVAAATVSTMRIIAKYAHQQKGARSFAIIWDGKYKFGVEGHDAFKAQVEALGGKIQADVKLDPDINSYAGEVAEFNGPNQCGNSACDAVVMLLLPDTAANWMTREPVSGRVYTAGAQTLFTEKFGEDCARSLKDRCNGVAVWTGYNPPIGRDAALPGVSTYVNDVKLYGVEARNQFAEGAYFGMNLFVEALKKVGPYLTREALTQALDSMDYNTDLASNLSWRAGKHNANVRARSFSAVYSGGKFTDWKDEATGWVLDPAFGG